MAGEFADDCREGLWTFWNEQGQKLAEGDYRAGWRHGKWTFFDAPGGAPRTTWFISDLEVPDLPRRTAELARLLDAEDWQTRVDAVDALGKLGALATPELRKALGNNDPVVAERVLEVLTSFGTEARDAVPDIRRLAENTAEGPVKTKTRLALLALDEPARDESLLALLMHADLNDDAACRELHMQMAQLGPPLLPHLAKALDSRDQQVRLAALDVLAVMLWPSEEDAWPFPHPEDYRGQLKQILERAQKHTDPVVVKSAKEILKFLTDPMLSIPWRKYSPSPYGGSIIPVVG